MKEDLLNTLGGYPIIITTRRIQNKKHRKKRINKKWQKQYGFTEYELQDNPYMIIDGKIYITYKAYNSLMKEVS